MGTQYQAPYYRRHLEQKNYSRLLAYPGRVAQASEFSDIQDILGSHIKSIGDAIMTDGNIIKGCDIVIDKTNKKVTITAGKVYLDGFVRDIPQTVLTNVSMSGTVTICAWVEESTVTSVDDADLNDPSLNGAYNQAGCDAIKYTVKVGVATGKPILYTLINGDLPTTAVTKNQYEPLIDIMARRTYDESGNYRVRGLRIMDRKSYDANNIYLTLTAGKAYIRGYEVDVPVDTKFAVKKTVGNSSVVEEKTKVSAKQYMLTQLPVASISDIAFWFKTTVQYQFPVGGDSSNMQSWSKLGVAGAFREVAGLTIKYGANDITSQLTSGTDYVFNTNGFQRLTTKVAPSGSLITLTFSYKITLTTADYTLNKDTGLVYYTGRLVPDDERPATIEYYYAMSHKDLISVDSNGQVVVHTGQPNVAALCSVPNVDDPNILPIGVVTSIAGNNTPVIHDQSVDVTQMAAIQRMFTKLEELQYNDAINNLDREAAEGEDATELIGVFTDGFIGWTKMDMGRVDKDCSIDSNGGYLTSSYDLQQFSLTPNVGANYANAIALGFTSVLTNMQTQVTDNIRVNPYNAFDPLVPLKITCYKYNQQIKYYNGAITYNATSSSILPWRNQLSCTDVQKEEATIKNGTQTINNSLVVYDRRNWYTTGGQNTILNYFGVSSMSQLASSGSAVTSQQFGSQNWSYDYNIVDTHVGTDVVQAYMKSKNIYVYATGFISYCDSIYVTFGGDIMDFIPTTDPSKQYSSGCTVGTTNATLNNKRTIKADANGAVLGYFTIPAHTPCGKYDIRVGVRKDASKGVIAKEGAATFDGQYTSQRTTTTITPVHKTLGVTIINTDPLAQSFSFSEDRFLTGVDLYFATKSNHPVMVQIRSMNNGYPGTDIYGEQSIPYGNIVTSTNGSAATTVTFDNPIRLVANTQYCIVILTDSDVTSVWKASLGMRQLGYNDNNDPNRQHFITTQPYQAGVLFTSSNNLTWTADNESDLKFGVRTAEFNVNVPKTIQYTAVTSSRADITNFALEVDYLLPTGCSLEWEYHASYMASNKWEPLAPFEEVSLPKAASSITVRVTMRTTNKYVSPILSIENCWLTYICNHSTVRYYSRMAELGDFDHLKIQVDLSNSTNHTHTVAYSVDSSSNFMSLKKADAEQTILGNGYIRYLWTIAKVGKSVCVRIDMSTKDPADIPKAQKLMVIGNETLR